MMRRIAILILMTIFCTLVARLADAYEVDTHEEISERAIRASDSAEYLAGIGLRSVDDTIMWQDEPTSLVALVRLGANSEDDILSGAFARYRHHFFDPLPDAPNGGGLTTTFAKGLPSPDWGLEDKGDILDQVWSLKDARQYLYDALTLTEDTPRKVSLPRTFVALGHVIHLIQDAAQPQHTRNDSHGGSVFGPKSLYERYTNRKNVLAGLPYAGHATVRFDGSRDFWVTDEQSGMGEGIAEFTNNNFVSAGTNFKLLGNNVAPNARYHLPMPEGFPETVAIDALVPEAERCQMRANGKKTCLEGTLTFFKTEVNDKHTGERQINPRASTLSIFDADLQKYNIHPNEPDELFPDRIVTYDRLFTLNKFNFVAAHQFLIPRAVAYSAGLIDYFFRGRLEAIDPTFTDEGVSLKVKNAIDAEKVPEWAEENLYAQKGQGQFVVTVKYKLGGEEKLITSDPVNLSTQEFISPGETADEVLNFALTTLPDDATNVEYRLVFRGRLGQEDDAIAVGVVEPASGFIVSPNYVPADGITGRRLIVRSGGKWRVTEDRNLQGGNIDWKGWYENGRPTKVLSWSGPKARHFPDRSGDPFSSSVYQNGERFAVSPIDVLGAAIAKDADGQEWLMVIAKSAVGDLVLKRPNKQSSSAGLFDPVTRPDGWQVIGNFPWESDLKPPNRPWFFNGDGTEAQTMREVNDPEPNKLDRLRIHISPDLASAELVNLGNLEGITDTVTNETETMGRNGIDVCNRVPRPRDSDHWHLSTTRRHSFSGEYIVAVDYQDKAEVLGVITGSGDSIWTATIDYDWDCQKNTVFGQIADSHVETFSQEGNESTELHIGEGGKSIKIDSRSASGYAERSQLNSDNAFRQGRGTVTQSISSLTELIYLDLRNNLYVAVETRVPNLSKEGSIIDAQACFDFVNESASIWVVSYTHDILIARHPLGEPSGRECGLGLPGVSPVVRTDPVETRIIFPTFRTGATPTAYNPKGSWTVSSGGQLFVSQEFRDEDNQVQYFNFLTGGQLEDVIPGALDGAHYFPAAVVR